MSTIHVKRFWTEYKTKAVNGEMQTVEQDMCEYGPIGSLDRSCVVATIASLSKITNDPDNPAAKLARVRWQQIKPRYDDWKAGRETPKEGTPLAAWPGISPEQAEHLRMVRVTVVEELAQLTDAHIVRMNLPNLRSMVEQAKIFVANKGAAAMTSELQRQKEEIEALKADLELAKKALLADMPDEAPRRRGRPPKVAGQTDLIDPTEAEEAA